MSKPEKVAPKVDAPANNAPASTPEPTAEVKLVGGDLTKGAAYIAANPTEYGFTWGEGPISGRLTKGGDLRELRKDAPRIVVLPHQVHLFIATFGVALVAKAINGTSIDVSCERIARDKLVDNHAITNTALQEAMVTSILLGVVVRGPVTVKTVYEVDGKQYADKASADAARAESDTAKYAAFLAMCAENGVPAEVARGLAALQFPNVKSPETK